MKPGRKAALLGAVAGVLLVMLTGAASTTVAAAVLDGLMEGTPPEARVRVLAGKVRTLAGLALFVGVAILLRRPLADAARRVRAAGAWRAALYLILLALPGIVFYVAAARALQVRNLTLAGAGFLSAIVLEVAIVASLIHLAGLARGGRLLAVVLVAMYQLLVLVLASFVGVIGEIELLKYADMIWGANLGYLLDPMLLVLLAGGVGATALLTSAVQRRLPRPTLRSGVALLGLAAAILLLRPAYLVGRLLELPQAPEQSNLVLTEAENVSAAVGGHLPRLAVAALTEEGYDTRTAVPPELEATRRRFGLFPESPPPCTGRGCPRFRRIILLTVESLSADFTAAGRPVCSRSLTPRLDSLMAAYPGGALRTNATPTLHALSAIFSGHPNAPMVIRTGYPNSFVRELGEHGYHTALLRSAPVRYANEHVHFRTAGFQEMVGREFFAAEPRWSRHVSEWGLEDRYLFDFALEYLEEHRDRPLFLHLLPADTHGPFGREHHTAPAPDLPGDLVCRPDNRRYLRSFYREDVLIGEFYRALIGRGLLDEQTLVIITGDHSSPRWYRPPPPMLDRVPVVFITRGGIQGLRLGDPWASQVDLAPTILELSGVRPPWGYVGRSLLHGGERRYFGMHGTDIFVGTGDGVQRIPMRSAAGEREELVRLLRTVFTDQPR